MKSITIKLFERKGDEEMQEKVEELEERCFLLEKALVNAVDKMLPGDKKELDRILGALLIHPPDKKG